MWTILKKTENIKNFHFSGYRSIRRVAAIFHHLSPVKAKYISDMYNFLTQKYIFRRHWNICQIYFREYISFLSRKYMQNIFQLYNFLRKYILYILRDMRLIDTFLRYSIFFGNVNIFWTISINETHLFIRFFAEIEFIKNAIRERIIIVLLHSIDGDV